MLTRELSFDLAACSVDAVQRAAYRFSDRLSLDLHVSEQTIACLLHLPSDDEEAAELVLADFRTEVLDQVLRERIRNETAGVRNLILAAAFSNSGLIEDSLAEDGLPLHEDDGDVTAA